MNNVVVVLSIISQAETERCSQKETRGGRCDNIKQKQKVVKALSLSLSLLLFVLSPFSKSSLMRNSRELQRTQKRLKCEKKDRRFCSFFSYV